MLRKILETSFLENDTEHNGQTFLKLNVANLILDKHTEATVRNDCMVCHQIIIVDQWVQDKQVAFFRILTHPTDRYTSITIPAPTTTYNIPDATVGSVACSCGS